MPCMPLTLEHPWPENPAEVKELGCQQSGQNWIGISFRAGVS